MCMVFVCACLSHLKCISHTEIHREWREKNTEFGLESEIDPHSGQGHAQIKYMSNFFQSIPEEHGFNYNVKQQEQVGVSEDVLDDK